MVKSEYISTTELAKLLGLSRITVYKKIKKGEIQAIRLGKNYAIPRVEVKRIVGDIAGHPLTDSEKEEIDRIVDKTVKEYGEVLRLLGKE